MSLWVHTRPKHKDRRVTRDLGNVGFCGGVERDMDKKRIEVALLLLGSMSLGLLFAETDWLFSKPMIPGNEPQASGERPVLQDLPQAVTESTLEAQQISHPSVAAYHTKAITEFEGTRSDTPFH